MVWQGHGRGLAGLASRESRCLQGAVELSVAVAVEPIPLGCRLTAIGWDRCDARRHDEGSFGVDPCRRAKKRRVSTVVVVSAPTKSRQATACPQLVAGRCYRLASSVAFLLYKKKGGELTSCLLGLAPYIQCQHSEWVTRFRAG